ncbi:hypothetical protein [Spiroplasma endosymbiont of Diplazon laetatorius]|uniref:hypothetical protein n=1 Tax=Spiroplasma endosymbiont of Diplazon laetatorius TaxID=3066322 RepID=UPI0030D4D88C
MPRKIQPNQVVTYKKKITYKEPNNTSFWLELLKVFGVQVLAVLAGSLTAGIGTAIVEGLGFTSVGIALTSSLIQTSVNFAITETFDSINGNLSTKNSLMNLLFGITGFGQLGRAFKYDKLLKILNENNLLKSVKIQSQVKNFYQIKTALEFKKIILDDKTVLTFGKTVTDIEILHSIAAVSTSEMKRSIKAFSSEEIKKFIEIQRTLYNISPELVKSVKNINISKYNDYFKQKSGYSINDFFKSDDLKASEIIEALSKTNLGSTTLIEFSMLRLRSKFQRTLIEQFKQFKKNAKKLVDKWNPFKIIQKTINEILDPIKKSISKITNKVNVYIAKLNKVSSNLLKKYNLIPCQPESFLLGFRFTPSGISGQGYCEIYKKPYVWKKTPGRISNYSKVTVFTDISTIEKFALAKDQNQFYKENWELGRGYKQADMKVLMLISPTLGKIYKNFNKTLKKIEVIKNLIKTNFISNLKSYSKSKLKNLYSSNKRKIAQFPFSKITGLNIFSSNLADLIINHQTSQKALFNNSVRKNVIKKVRRVRVIA